MTNSASRIMIREAVIDHVLSNIPILKARSRRHIEDNYDKEIMAFFGILVDAYGELLDELEFEFSITRPENMHRKKTYRRKFFLFTIDSEEYQFELNVPDLSCNELEQICYEGVWPEEFYQEID